MFVPLYYSGLMKQGIPATTPSSLASVSRLIQQEGLFRLWRGVSTMFIACIPAHAAYFSVLETCKAKYVHALDIPRSIVGP
jgi:hypothetical protein